MALKFPRQTHQLHWHDTIAKVPGVGDGIAKKLEKLHLHALGDLLLHFPYKYQDRTRITPIRHLPLDQDTYIQGTVVAQKEVRHRRKQLTISLEDGTATIDLTFFHYFPNLVKILKKGQILRCYGRAKLFQNKYAMVHPEFEMLKTADAPLADHFTPVYRSVPGVSQKWWRKTIDWLMPRLDQIKSIDTVLLDSIIEQKYPFSLKAAILQIHQPSPEFSIPDLTSREAVVFQRVIFEELVAHRLSLQAAFKAETHMPSAILNVDDDSYQQLIKSLPFALTEDQSECLNSIRCDLAKSTPMMRLLQGDVGSGKTIVALIASWIAMQHGKQVAIMAPTEVLAEQLYQQATIFFKDNKYNCILLTGSLKAKPKKEALAQIESGCANLAVGTHALFQKDVNFKNVALVIIDEQHRFGVHQRLSLSEKGKQEQQASAHQLIMTATPIPRTLCMSYYAHLATSQIRTMPKGRKPIQTVALSTDKQSTLLNKIKKHCESKQQVYWVCTLVEESEHFDAKPAIEAAEAIQKALPMLTVGLMHGKMSALDKQQVMQKFSENHIHILVATTVIEVGVNVPNATLMVIENAERLGLSQLHQLRGRVGRGELQSYCVLLYQQPLSFFAKKRIETLRETTDGFEIAEKDLALRGPGEVLGTRQSGMAQLRIANIIRDHHMLSSVNQFLSNYQLPEDEINNLKERWFKHTALYANA